jgi:hypothetical protein
MRAERIGPRHLDALAPMLADPRVGATMGGVLDREQVAEQLAELDGKWERDGFGYYMWFDTATGAPVARGGLSRAEFDGRPEVELGWLVTPARWGEGLATEVGAAAVEVAFGRRRRRLHPPRQRRLAPRDGEARVRVREDRAVQGLRRSRALPPPAGRRRCGALNRRRCERGGGGNPSPSGA